MNLVDEQDDVVGLADLVDDLLDAVLELASILGAGDQGAHIERPDLLAAQHLGHRAVGGELRQALDHGGLANAGVTQDERVVLLATRKHLHHALGLAVAADDGVELAVDSELGEVAAIALEHRAILRGGRGRATRADAGVTQPLVRLLGDELLDGVADRVSGDAHAGQRGAGHAAALAHDAKQEVLGGDVVLVAGDHLAIGALEHRLGARGERDVATGRGLALVLGEGPDRFQSLLVGDVERGQRLGGDALPLLYEAEQQVLGAHILLVELARVALGTLDGDTCLVGELLEH